MQQHAGQRVTVALAAGEDANRFENVVFGEEETAEQVTQLGVGGRGAASQRSSSMRASGSSSLY